MSKPTVYLDHAAATPIGDDVLQAMQPYFQEQFYNPSALYLAAKQVHRAVTAARESVARVLGARPNEVVFTAGGTEANNLAISGVMQQFPNGNVVTTAIEHDSVLSPVRQYDYQIAAVTPKGVLDMASLRERINDRTVLVSVMYVNNEVGTIQPITEVVKLVRTIRRERATTGNAMPLYMHTDACQAANYLPLTQSRLGVDLMTLNGGKIYGPKQSGCLYVRTGVELHPQILGGGQERGMRSGTENVPGIVGFAHALTKAAHLREAECRRLGELQAKLASNLLQQFPDVIVHSVQPMVPNFVHVRIPGTDNERLIMELDERGIMAAAGSACSASNDEPSHVLTAMGLTDEQAQSSIRFTMGRLTTAEGVDNVLQALADINRSMYTGAS
ncbi:cysteine desulfurase [Patescibacteria group bacterium]|nr:MAG: cysteine desulfurase [Patescibacteria group bacterium]